MELLNDLKENWNLKNNSMQNPENLSQSSFTDIIRFRANREKNQVIQYFWASLAYQIILYSLCCFTFFKNPGNRSIGIAVLAGLCVNIPFTWALIKRFQIMYGHSLSRLVPADSIRKNLELYSTRLSSFFRFKKIADGIILPANAFLIVYVLFELFAAGGLLNHPAWGMVLFLIIWLSCGIAVHLENKNRFRKPMRRIASILREFEQADQEISVDVIE